MMFTKVSVLVPTRGRPERIRTLLDSYEQTQTPGLSELVFRVDDDDAQTLDVLMPLTRALVVGPRGGGYADMPKFFNELHVASTGDVLMCGNDDMVFQTPGWAERVLVAANRYQDGLFNLGVRTHNEDHYPFSIVSRRAADHLGFLWDPRIFWGDIYLRDVMAYFGRCEMLPDVYVDHDWAGNRPDQVFRESDKNIELRDRAYWSVTHATAVREAVERLQPLLAEPVVA